MATKKEAAEETISSEPEIALAKYLTFDYHGTTYTMEYNRRSVEVLQKQLGVDVTELVKGNVNILDLPAMFRCSLILHHPNMKQETVDMLFAAMGDRAGLLRALSEMILGTVNTLYEEPKSGNVISWTQH